MAAHGTLQAGLRDGDQERVERASHSLKSSAANVGAMTASQLARAIEHAASEHDLVEAGRLAPELEEALEGAFTALRDIQKEAEHEA